jgi:cytochrome bd-type quinol oxidase subunit 2
MTLNQLKKEGRVRLYFTFGVITILLSIVLFVLCAIENKRVHKHTGEVFAFYQADEDKFPMVKYDYNGSTYISALRGVDADSVEIGDSISFYMDSNYPGKIESEYKNLDPIAIVLLVIGVGICALTHKGTKGYYEKFFRRYMITYIFIVLTIIALVAYAIYARFHGHSILLDSSYEQTKTLSIMLMAVLFVDVVIGMAVQNKYEKAHMDECKH